MSRDVAYKNGYLPLFAGAELIRRSGALTQFPADNLIGTLPTYRVRSIATRFLIESIGAPGCTLGPGEVYTFLWLSNFGTAVRPEASNWFWRQPTLPVEFPNRPGNATVTFNVNPGTPGNNLAINQSLVYGNYDTAIIEGGPLLLGDCNRFRLSTAWRVYQNNYFADDTELFFQNGPSDLQDQAPQTQRAFGIALGRTSGTMKVSARHWTSDGVVDTFTLPAFTGGAVAGGSDYIEVIADFTPEEVALQVLVNGVPRARLTGPAEPLQTGWSSVNPFIRFSGAATRGGTEAPGWNTELYTGWKLERI